MMNEWFLGGFCIFLTLVGVFYPLRRYVGVLVCGVPVVIVFVVWAYMMWGAGAAWHAYQERERARAVFSVPHGITLLQDKIKAQLKTHPHDARGWFLLGRLYVAQQKWPEASEAFKRAYHLTPHDPAVLLNYAQSVSVLHHGALNKTLRSLLKKTVTHHLQPDALMLLAMDAYQHHHDEQAIAYWQEVLPLLPVRSAEARAVQEALVQARTRSAQDHLTQ